VDAPAWIEVVELQRRLAAGDALFLVDVRQPEEFTARPGPSARCRQRAAGWFTKPDRRTCRPATTDCGGL